MNDPAAMKAMDEESVIQLSAAWSRLRVDPSLKGECASVAVSSC
jgi:hypothetical protein